MAASQWEYGVWSRLNNLVHVPARCRDVEGWLELLELHLDRAWFASEQGYPDVQTPVRIWGVLRAEYHAPYRLVPSKLPLDRGRERGSLVRFQQPFHDPLQSLSGLLCRNGFLDTLGFWGFCSASESLSPWTAEPVL